MINKIKNDLTLAMKERRAEDKECLSMLYTKLKNKSIDIRPRELTDADCVSIIQKFIKELEEERDMFAKAGRIEVSSVKDRNIELVKIYLPKMMSEDEIKTIINSLTDKSMPSIMKHFKMNYQGKVDMGSVSKIAKNL